MLKKIILIQICILLSACSVYKSAGRELMIQCGITYGLAYRTSQKLTLQACKDFQVYADAGAASIDIDSTCQAAATAAAAGVSNKPNVASITDINTGETTYCQLNDPNSETQQ